MTPELKSLQRRIESLEREVARLKGQSSRTTATIEHGDPARRFLPVNHVAFEKAMQAYFAGNRTALSKYMELYRVPAS